MVKAFSFRFGASIVNRRRLAKVDDSMVLLFVFDNPDDQVTRERVRFAVDAGTTICEPGETAWATWGRF